jgi:hypothetical protein
MQTAERQAVVVHWGLALMQSMRALYWTIAVLLACAPQASIHAAVEQLSEAMQSASQAHVCLLKPASMPVLPPLTSTPPPSTEAPLDPPVAVPPLPPLLAMVPARPLLPPTPPLPGFSDDPQATSAKTSKATTRYNRIVKGLQVETRGRKVPTV